MDKNQYQKQYTGKDNSHQFVKDQHIKLTGANSQLKTGVSYSDQPGHEQNCHPDDKGQPMDEGKFITQEGKTELKAKHLTNYEKRDDADNKKYK